MAILGRPRPESPYTQEEVAMARKNWLQAHNTPKAQMLLGKLVQLGLIGLILYLFYALDRKDAIIASFRPVVVRVNDVGRAEAVKLDESYIPEEPELRDNLSRLVVRMFERNGFTLPVNMETNSFYLAGGAWETWFKESFADLDKVAKMENLARVRILQTRIESCANAKTDGGTTSVIRYATDKLTPNGSLVPNSAVGYEITLRFRIGSYPSIPDGVIRDRWITRNPLGMRIGSYKVERYIGPDVEAPDAGKPIDVQLPGLTGSYAKGAEGTPSTGNIKIQQGRN